MANDEGLLGFKPRRFYNFQLNHIKLNLITTKLNLNKKVKSNLVVVK